MTTLYSQSRHPKLPEDYPAYIDSILETERQQERNFARDLFWSAFTGCAGMAASILAWILWT